MKKLKQFAFGVTLLEIMLVLAIAALIIVLSIRYYQSAGSSSQANTIVEQIQAITAMADNLAESSPSGTSYSSISNTTLSPMLPSSGLTAPWGSTITISGASATQYTVTVNSTPSAVCTLILPKLQSNAEYTSVSCANGTLSYTFQPAQ